MHISYPNSFCAFGCLDFRIVFFVFLHAFLSGWLAGSQLVRQPAGSHPVSQPACCLLADQKKQKSTNPKSKHSFYIIQISRVQMFRNPIIGRSTHSRTPPPPTANNILQFKEVRGTPALPHPTKNHVGAIRDHQGYCLASGSSGLRGHFTSRPSKIHKTNMFIVGILAEPNASSFSKTENNI